MWKPHFQFPMRKEMDKALKQIAVAVNLSLDFKKKK